MKKIIIQDRIFEMFPEFRREVVIVRSINNRPSYKRIRRLLKQEIGRRANTDLDREPCLLSWDEVHSKPLVINVDCLPPVTPETALQVRDELAKLLEAHCDAKTETGSLYIDCREYTIM